MRIPEFWAGSEATLDEYLMTFLLSREVIQGPQGAELPFLSKLKGKSDDDDDVSLEEFLASRLISIDGAVGVVNVKGSISSEASIWELLFGGTSYPAITRAAEKLADEEKVGAILLNLSTGGGDASGIDEVSQKLQQIDAKVPVYAWTGSRALSAGYWLGSAARQFHSTRMAETGSIGVVSTHVSMARMLKDEGYDITVVRAGKYKALGHPAEKLSEEGLKIMEEKTGKLNNFFLQHVASRRGLSISSKADWAEGRTFFGEEARSVGLIDSVISYKELIADLNRIHSPKERSMKRTVVSEQGAAALAAGASLEQVEHEELEVSEDTVSQTVEEPAAEATEQPAASAPPQESELVSFLRQELAAERAEHIKAKVKMAALEAQLADATAAADSLLPVAIEATQRMQIGLNQAPNDMAGMSAATVLEQYRVVKATFERSFMIGRKSLSVEQTDKPAAAEVEARRLGITPKEGRKALSGSLRPV